MSFNHFPNQRHSESGHGRPQKPQRPQRPTEANEKWHPERDAYIENDLYFKVFLTSDLLPKNLPIKALILFPVSPDLASEVFQWHSRAAAPRMEDSD